MDKYGTGQDPYCYPGTDVLRNKLEIFDAVELEEAERELSLINADSIELFPAPYNFAYLKRLHHQLFHDLYDWAGEVRTIDMPKGIQDFATSTASLPRLRSYSPSWQNISTSFSMKKQTLYQHVLSYMVI